MGHTYIANLMEGHWGAGTDYKMSPIAHIWLEKKSRHVHLCISIGETNKSRHRLCYMPKIRQDTGFALNHIVHHMLLHTSFADADTSTHTHVLECNARCRSQKYLNTVECNE